MKTLISIIFMQILCGTFLPLFGADAPSATAGSPGTSGMRSAPITVNLIIDGSQAVLKVMNDLNKKLSENLVDGILQSGDRLIIWSAGKTAQILYSETIKSENDRENIKKVLTNLPAQGDSADFSTALQNAARQKSDHSIQLIMLVSVSHTSLSPLALGDAAPILRYSRVEEFSGWRMLVIAPGINDKVRQAAAAYFSGS
jgi:hypothetical protein